MLRTICEFANNISTNGIGSGGQHSQIEELAHTIPPLTTETKSQPAGPASGAAAGSSTGERKEEPSGILALITEATELKRKLHVLDESLKTTDSLTHAAKKQRNPLIAEVSKFATRHDDM